MIKEYTYNIHGAGVFLFFILAESYLMVEWMGWDRMAMYDYMRLNGENSQITKACMW